MAERESYGTFLDSRTSKKLKNKWNIIVGLIALGACVASIGFTFSPPQTKDYAFYYVPQVATIERKSVERSPLVKADLSGRKTTANSLAGAVPDSLNFLVSTKYTRRGDPPVYSDYSWATGPIVEPYVPSTLTVERPVEGVTYQWVWQSQVYTGASLEIMVTDVGTQAITLRALASSGNLIAELQTNIVIKYVRREIRSLLKEDREAFFDALQYLVQTPTEVGREIYGPKYRSMLYYVSQHGFLSASSCDHLHQGSGFLTNHMGLTLELEQALQVVNPAVTVPYWDYTIDFHAVLENDEFRSMESFWSSVVFDPDWFGSYSQSSYTLETGRWSGILKVETDAWHTSAHNSYGMLRAPWNNNNSPVINRFDKVSGSSISSAYEFPSCEMHFEFGLSSHTLEDFLHYVARKPHGSLHEILGGSLDKTGTYKKLEDFMLPSDIAEIKTKASTRELWRQGLLQCPEVCEMDTPTEECTCSCGSRQELRDKLGANRKLLSTVWQKASYLSKTETYTTNQKTQFIELLCESGVLWGDQAEAFAPLDLIFWPIHPTVERLGHWNMLSVGLLDQQWPTSENNYWGGGPLGTNEARCHGHAEHDLLPWKIVLDNGETEAKQYKNYEMYVVSNPSRLEYALPYVYDSFTWEHCAAEGYDFNT